MTIAAPVNGYSAQVRLELLVGNQRFRLAQIGGGRLVLKSEAILLGTSGEIHCFIDDHEQRWTATWEACDEPRRIVPVTLSAPLLNHQE